MQNFLKHYSDPATTDFLSDALKNLRLKAFNYLKQDEKILFPQENWKYSSLQHLQNIAWQNPKPSPQDKTSILNEKLFHSWAKISNHHFLFLNGKLVQNKLSDDLKSPHLQSTNLFHFLKRKDEPLQELLEFISDKEEKTFLELNNAYTEEGALIIIPKNCHLVEPILIVHLNHLQGGEWIHPRHLISAGENSSAKIIEVYFSENAESYLTNSVTQIQTEQNANIEHYRIQLESEQASHLSQTLISQHKNSYVKSLSLSLGALWSRNHISVSLMEEGANCHLEGLFIGDKNQHIDNQTFISHLSPNTQSSQLYKGILAGQSKGVFHGKIKVAPHAKYSQAKQKNANLLVSNQAEMNTQPTLEIDHNEVKCAHGASIGKLNDKELYYLRSRGIEETEAKIILTQAFAEEIITSIQIPLLKEKIEKEISNKISHFAGGNS